MDNQPVKNGIIYVRVSSAEQVENTSLESQERNCREYAKREGINVLNVYVEEGESAKTANRTQFMKAITFCTDKKNKVTHFIVYKLDRFARNQNDHVITQMTLRKQNVALRSVTEPIDETPIGRVMEGVISVFAEFDNNVRTERSKGGMMEKVKKGIWVWNAPIGYYRIYKGANLSPEPSTAHYIKTIFEEYSKGTYTYRSLAEHMNKLGFKTMFGKNICMQLIEKILKNPLYCGRIKVWGLDIKGDFEAIVDEELFLKCQKGYRKKYTKMNRSIKNADFPLRRICVCPECDTSITGSSSRGSKGGKYSYYHHHKQECTKAKFIPKEVFEQMFVEYLNEITPDIRYEKIFKAIVLDIWQSNYKKLDENNAKVRTEIDRLEQERQKIFDLHRNGKYSDDEFQEQKEVINKKMYNKRQLLQGNHIEEFNMEETLNHCFSFIRETSKTWIHLKNTNYVRTMQFQKQIFPDKITFDGEKFGTKELSLIYKMNQVTDADKSHLVSVQQIELIYPLPCKVIYNISDFSEQPFSCVGGFLYRSGFCFLSISSNI